MIVRFFDRQHPDNPLNGRSFEDFDSLITILNPTKHEHPFFCELIGQNDYKILIGVGDPWSCSQYSREDGNPPYLMALHSEVNEDGNDLEFLIGYTLTPVPYRFRLSRSQLEEIVRYFIETGKCAPNFRWEEI